MYNSSDLIILDHLINDEAKVPLLQEYGKKQVILTETQGVNYEVKIKGIPDDTLVIKTDFFHSPHGFFKGINGECKRCDYLIISHTDKYKYKFILLIEMKAGKAIEKEVIQQLKGGKCLLKYCQEIGREFWQESTFLNDYHYRFISFKHINIPKKTTKEKQQQKIHDTPENMLKIYSPKTLHFNKLIGNL